MKTECYSHNGKCPCVNCDNFCCIDKGEQGMIDTEKLCDRAREYCESVSKKNDLTENKRMSISGLLEVLNTGISLSTCHIEYAIQSNVLEDLILCLEELEQYRAIGTVESLKNLPAICDSLAESSEKAEKLIEELQAYRAIGTIDEFKAFKLGRLGNKGFITIGQTIEEFKEEIRNKAIDEFAEKLNTDVESFVAEVDGVRADLLTLDYFSEFVFDVAEELKGGAE